MGRFLAMKTITLTQDERDELLCAIAHPFLVVLTNYKEDRENKSLAERVTRLIILRNKLLGDD